METDRRRDPAVDYHRAESVLRFLLVLLRGSREGQSLCTVDLDPGDGEMDMEKEETAVSIRGSSGCPASWVTVVR